MRLVAFILLLILFASLTLSKKDLKDTPIDEVPSSLADSCMDTFESWSDSVSEKCKEWKDSIKTAIN